MIEKKSKEIDLSYLYFDKRDLWFDTPDSFSAYKSSFNKECLLGDLRKKQVYLDLGYATLANEVEEDIKDSSIERYHGFYQIKLTIASMIIAKVSNFYFAKEGIFYKEDSGLFAYYPILVPVKEVASSLLNSFSSSSYSKLFDLLTFIVPSHKGGPLLGDSTTDKIIEFALSNKYCKLLLLGEKSKKFYMISVINPHSTCEK